MLHTCTKDNHRTKVYEKFQSDPASLSYTAITKEEIYAFCGSVMIMDIYIFNCLEMYWGLRGSLVGIPAITDAFKYSRYSEIREHLKCNDNNVMAQNLCTKVSECMVISKHVAVDEQLRLFKGRSSDKVSIDRKPAGTGMNAYILADGVSKLPIWYSINGKGSSNHVELGIVN